MLHCVDNGWMEFLRTTSVRAKITYSERHNILLPWVARGSNGIQSCSNRFGNYPEQAPSVCKFV
jgi:hypothetical protein